MSNLREDWLQEVKANPRKYSRYWEYERKWVVDRDKIIQELECSSGTARKLGLILEKQLANQPAPPPISEKLKTVTPYSLPR